MAEEAEVVEAEVTTLARRESTEMQSWEGASERAISAKRERQKIIEAVLVEGEDYGVIPGTGTKPVLYKSGAEKVADAFNLCPVFELLPGSKEDWDKPLFHYRYRCSLRWRGTEVIVSTGVGSCNSMEATYRWREKSRVCPACGAEAIIKGRPEYGGGWLCWQRKGGCNAKYADDDPIITNQESGKVPNEDVFTQVNSIDKKAQKRALVAAVLLLGFSQQFTQDIEDNPESFQKAGEKTSEPKSNEPVKGDTTRLNGLKGRSQQQKPPERRQEREKEPPPQTISNAMIGWIYDDAKKAGMASLEELEEWCQLHFGCAVAELPASRVKEVREGLRELADLGV